MELYTKIEDGVQIIKPANKIVIIQDGFQIFNPTEEMLINNGWTPYTQNLNDLNQIYQNIKSDLVTTILNYDSSDDVNLFYVNDLPMWLDKATRVGLKLRFDAELESAKTETVLWYNGISFTLKLDNAVKMLNAIELYASACYDNTQAHIANVKALEDIEAIKNYDYTTGYPEKLRF